MSEYYFIGQRHRLYACDNSAIVIYSVLVSIMYLIFFEINWKFVMLSIVTVFSFAVIIKNIHSIHKGRDKIYCSNLKFILLFSLFQSILIIILAMLLFSFDYKYIMIFLSLIIISILVWIMNNSCKTYGMYIIDNNIYYRYYIKKIKINISDIKAVAVTKTQYASGYTTSYEKVYNENGKGDFLYSIVFLNKIEKEMYNVNGNLSFRILFPKNMICDTIYDEKLINYIKDRNPNIVVMSDIYS